MTISKMFRDRAAKWAKNTCVKFKKDGVYADMSWGDFYGQVLRSASALIKAGLKTGDRAAILSHTRWEWSNSDAAILSAGGIVVPIYPSLTGPEVLSLLNRSRSRFVFCSDAALVKELAAIIDDATTVEKVIVFEKEALAGVANPKFTSLEEFSREKADVAAINERIDASSPDDVCTIIFTSGTTGEPKGVMLSHGNIMSNAGAALDIFDIGLGDTHLSHLPLAHVLERMGCYVMFYSGAVVAYAENMNKVAENISEVAPTVCVSVPRIFEKIYAGIQAKAMEEKFPKKQIAFWAIDVATKVGDRIDARKPVGCLLQAKFNLADKLVYSKIRQKFGGRIRIFVSGGAPLAPELAKFFCAIGIPIYEGYGLTETSPIITANQPGRQKAGAVGFVVPGVQIKIAVDG
ncbi:long-chain fatty acid--CoA ligase, partial [bacterium]